MIRVLCIIALGLSLALTSRVDAAADAPMTLEQAAAQVQKRTGGRILAAERKRVNGKLMYRIKVLKDGHVRSVFVDPQRGR